MLLALADYHTQLAQYDSAAHYLPAAGQQVCLYHNQGGGALPHAPRPHCRPAGPLRSQPCPQAPELSNTGSTRRFRTSAQIQFGKLYAKVGDYAAARTCLVGVQRTAEHYDYPDRLNLAPGELGEVSRQQRQRDTARRYYTQSIAISPRSNDQPTELTMQLNSPNASSKWSRPSSRA